MTNDERLYESNCADARRNLRHYSDHPCLPPLMSPEDVKKVEEDGKEIFGGLTKPELHSVD